MAEFKTSLAAERPEEALNYSPLSGLAIASVAIAAVYALVVSVLSAVALWSGDPLPLGMSSLIVPATSGVLALLARRQIGRAEGTRSGARLASWGWWLSVGFGLGYAGFYVGTYLAVSYQAENFAQRFFDEIREGKLNHAFLRTQDPEQRQDISPDNQQLMTIRFGTAPGGTRK